MDPYFDEPSFDDLINDDIEDSFEPRSQFDEAMFEDAIVQQTTQSTQQPTANHPDNEVRYNLPVGPSVEVENVDMTQEPAEDSPANDADDMAPLLTGRSQTDLYSFERFTKNRGWRRTESNDDGQEAREWKPASHRTQQAYNLHGPTAPDAQLLDMLERSSRRRRQTPLKASPRLSLHPPVGLRCLSMTLGDGTRVHIPCREPTIAVASESRRHHNTLGVSMKNLVERVKSIRRRKEHEALKAVGQTNQSHSQDSDDEEDEEPDLAQESSAAIEHTRLWVDKHAPSSFSHLLSDERTNREVLRAIRAWDPYVFHRDPPSRPAMGGYGAHHTTKQTPEATKLKDKRPSESSRVLLLSGPPGVGKTTLAHIAAAHAGYRPIEVNGSDERSEASLTDRVIRAMESSTLSLRDGDFDASGKPNCLILDEIDGADAKTAIQALVNIIRADIPAKGSRGKATYLRRPIIFVCNNKYAPALKPLLPFATQFNVSPPSTNRLVARLRSVLSSEKLSVLGGSALLNQLVTTTCGDIRSCLYTLQFASSRAKTMAKPDATVVDISQALQSALKGDGMKDERNDVVGAITAVFRKEKEAVVRGAGSQARLHTSSTDHVLSLVQGFGDNSRVLDCLFMNVPNVSYIDPGFDRCAAAYEWLSSSDMFRSTSSDMYIPASAGAVHLLCRVEQRQELTFSTREMADVRYQRDANAALARKTIEGFSTRIRGRHHSRELALETIPYVLWILSSGEGSSALRRGTTAVDLLSKQERVAFDNHVDVLQSLGLTYVRDADASFGAHDHDLSVRLEPPIEKLSLFMGMEVPSTGTRLVIPPTLKELLARQAVQGRLLEDGARPQARSHSTSSREKVSLPAQESQTPSMLSSTSIGSNQSQNSIKRTELAGTGPLPPSKRSKRTLTSENFLGLQARKAKEARSARTAARVGLSQSKKMKLSHAGSGVPLSEVIRLKYVKGFTQAVRTPCRIEDLV